MLKQLWKWLRRRRKPAVPSVETCRIEWPVGKRGRPKIRWGYEANKPGRKQKRRQ